MKPSAFLAGAFPFSCLMRSTLSSNNIEPPTATNSAGHRVDSGKTRVSNNQMMVSLRLGLLRPGSSVPSVCEEQLRKRRLLMENRDGASYTLLREACGCGLVNNAFSTVPRKEHWANGSSGYSIILKN
jgi:hypothetical protein